MPCSSKPVSCRESYVTARDTAKVAKMIEAGEEVQPLNRVSLQTASWLVTRGEGIGKAIWR